MQRISGSDVVLSHREYKKYQTRGDYSKDNLQMGVTAIAGRQSSIMVDFLSMGMEEVKGFERLTKAQQEIVLLLTFDELQQTIGTELEAGATGCLAISYVDKSDILHTAVMNLGPGFAYSVTGSTATHFDTPAHTTLDLTEIARITEQDGLVVNSKLSGEYSFTRAFGYKSVDIEGLSHMPEILFSEKKLNGNTAHILLSNHPLEEEKISDLFQKQATKTPVMLSSQLVDDSFATGIKENIVQGVMVPDDSTTVSMSLFRGIEKFKVSEALSKQVYPLLQQKIQALLNPDPKIQAAYANRVRVLKMAFYFRQGNFSYFKEAYEHDQKAVEAELNKLELKESIKQKLFFQALAEKETQYIAACLLTQWWSYHELQDEDGNTPLMYAARLGNESLVSKLLAAKVDLDVTNNAGETALMLAKNYPHIVKMLSPPPLDQKELPPEEGKPVPAKLTNLNYQKIAVKSDYQISLTKDKLKIGGCAIKGRTPRPKTESYLKIGIDEVADFETLTEEEQKLALFLTFDDLQQKTGNQKEADASACVAITYYDKKTDLQHTVVAYLGDTLAHMVKISTVGETKHLQLNERLLACLPSEAEQLSRDFYGKIILKDLSRALGATDSEYLGLSHVPKVKHFTEKCDGSTIFTLVGAGLDILGIDQFVQTVKHYQTKSPDKIASELVNQAFSSYITQNQVQGVMISKGHTLPASLVVVSSKQDSTVSEPASKQVYAILQNYIQQLHDPKRALLLKMAFYARQGKLDYFKEAFNADKKAVDDVLKELNLSDAVKSTLFLKAITSQEHQDIAEYFLTDTIEKPAWPFHFHRDDKENRLPLEWARRYDNKKLATLLLKKDEVDCVLKANKEKTHLTITFKTPEEAELFLQKISATDQQDKSLSCIICNSNKVIFPLRAVAKTDSNKEEYAIDLGDHQFILNFLKALNQNTPKSDVCPLRRKTGASFQLSHSFNDDTFIIYNRVPGYSPNLEAKSLSRFYQEESIYLNAKSPIFSETGLIIHEVSLADFKPLPAPLVNLTHEMHEKMTYQIIKPRSFFGSFFSSIELPDLPHITLSQNASGKLIIDFKSEKKPELLTAKYYKTGELGEGFYASFSSHEKMLEFLNLFNYKMNPLLESVCKPSVINESSFLYFPKESPVFKMPGTILKIYLPLDSPALKPIEPSRTSTHAPT